MTLEILLAKIEEARSHAATNAEHCERLIAQGGLPEVLAYCKKLFIEPPQFSLTAQSPNADRLRAAAQRKLSDQQWWGKVLEEQAIQHYEAEQMRQGNVRMYVSDGLAEYHALRSRRR